MSSQFFGVVTDEHQRDKTWGYIKVFGSMGLTMVFAIASMLAVARHIETIDPVKETGDGDAAGGATKEDSGERR